MIWVEIYALLVDIGHIKSFIFSIFVPQIAKKNATFEIKSTKIDVCWLVGVPQTRKDSSGTNQSA